MSVQNKDSNSYINQILSHANKEVLKGVAAVIDTHINVKNDQNFASNYLNISFKDGQFFDGETQKQVSEESMHWRSQGMHITQTNDTQRYPILKDIMGYIQDGLKDLNLFKSDQQNEDERYPEEQDHLVSNGQKVDSNVITFCGNKYRLREEYRESYSVDTVEECYVKAVAVSILAESNGKSAVAREVLENGGMHVVKNLQEVEVLGLLGDLQVLALDEVAMRGVEEAEMKNGVPLTPEIEDDNEKDGGIER